MRAGWTTRVRAVQDQMSATERALAESNERYRSLFAYSPHAAFSLDLDGTFTDANEVAQRLSGFTLDELLGMNFAELIAPEHVPLTVAAFEGALNRRPQQLCADMNHRDGHVIEMSLTAVPVVVHDQVVGVHGVAEDITESNEMRRELERTRVAAEEASAAKSLFLANMSHEVRTPLTSVLGATEMLAEGDLDPHEHHLVEIIHRSGKRLLRLVNDILDVSRLEAGKLDLDVAPFSVRQLVRDIEAWAAPMAHREKLGFSWILDPGVPAELLGDSMRITQVLTNLLGNAFKFTEEGDVRLAVELAGTEADAGIRFTVEDSGIGIAEDQLSRLFQSFTQADTSTTRKYGGAGLGLSICQELLQLMGGCLTADSAPGHGSTFSFALPLQPATPDAEQR